jgi:hypothetical protein
LNAFQEKSGNKALRVNVGQTARANEKRRTDHDDVNNLGRESDEGIPRRIDRHGVRHGGFEGDGEDGRADT